MNKQTVDWPCHLALRDTNPDMVMAWLDAFADFGPWSIGSNNILRQQADALVSPANSYGHMDGGIDLAYRNHFGLMIQNRLQQYLAREYQGMLPVGQAIIIPTDNRFLPRLIVAPTMERPMNISNTNNAYLAMKAVLQTINHYNQQAIANQQPVINAFFVQV